VDSSEITAHPRNQSNGGLSGDTAAHPVIIGPGLLTREIVGTLGLAFPAYLWFVSYADATGAVLAGCPITLASLAHEWGDSLSTIKAKLRRLRTGGFIRSESGPHGIRVWIIARAGLIFDPPNASGPESSPPTRTTEPSQSEINPPATDGGVKNDPAMESGQAEINPPASGTVEILPTATKPTIQPDRFQALSGAWRDICRQRGCNDNRSFEEIQAALAFVRGHPYLGADNLVQLAQRFAAGCQAGELRLCRFLAWLEAGGQNASN
jgi:hypothetical protein